MCSGERSASTAEQYRWIAEAVARKRAGLILAYRTKLREEEVEECISQAVVELLARARRGAGFASPLHASRALEQKVRSRVIDRLRAFSGRSPLLAELARSRSRDQTDRVGERLADPRLGVEELVCLRQLLGLIPEAARELTVSQRTALALEVAGVPAVAWGWSPGKRRKLCARGRIKLRASAALEGWDG
jgi:hypothetical protein